MAIVLSRDDKIVLFVNSYTREEFRQKFLYNIAKRGEFSAVLIEESPMLEDLKTIRNLMIEAGIPEDYLMTNKQIREAAQAVSNRIMESLNQ